jgi:hypothetical protein
MTHLLFLVSVLLLAHHSYQCTSLQLLAIPVVAGIPAIANFPAVAVVSAVNFSTVGGDPAESLKTRRIFL